MRKIIVCGLMLSGCASTAVGADVPDREPLAHFCSSLATGPSAESLKGDALQRQQKWLEEMTASAVENKVSKWTRFVRQLEKLDASERQAWMEAGVQAHNLEKECAALTQKEPSK